MKFDTGNNLLACSQTPVWEHTLMRNSVSCIVESYKTKSRYLILQRDSSLDCSEKNFSKRHEKNKYKKK